MVTIDGDEIVSGSTIDGDEFSEITVDGDTVWAAIPDSEADQKLAHRWVLNDVNGTVEDSEGNADGTNNGISSTTGNWAGALAGEGDGDSHILTSDLGTFGSNRNSCAIAVSVQHTADHGTYLGVRDGNNEEMQMFVGDSRRSAPAGHPGLHQREGDGGRNSSVWTENETVNDGNPYRIVFNSIDINNDDYEIWINQTEADLTTDIDGQDPEVDDFQDDLALFAENFDGTIVRELDGIIDDICVYDDSLTQSEIQSYENPWD